MLRPPDRISAAEVIGAVEKSHRGASVRTHKVGPERAIDQLWQEIQQRRRSFLAQITLLDLVQAGGAE